MGSQLTKNYDIDKEPYMQAGLHNLWKVYRGKKKDRGNMDVSIFIFEKKQLEKKKLSQNQKDEICTILKKDPQTLAKFRHPNLLSLIEQPLEDNKIIVFVTEPVEYNLSSLVYDANMKDKIPGDLEIKCLMLELLEGLNFLHSSAKTIHMALAPEHIYVTKEGRLKIAGLNFPQQFSTAEQLNVPLNYDLKLGDVSMVPNLQFAAPEISDQQQVSVQSDVFSIGALLYFMVALNKNKSPFFLNLKDITDKASHKFEVNCLDRKLPSLFAGFEHEIEAIVRQTTNIKDPQMRGTLNQLVEKQWFQDPLLKTIKYLENFDQKEHANKVQFLTGIHKILDKFDKKALVKKVIPLLLDAMKVPQLSVQVLPCILYVMEKQNFITTTEFREYIWPSISKLCKAKELPAQSLFIILKNTEQFLKYVGPSEFQAHFMPLLLKSLECGVAKLQFLALNKVSAMYKSLDYTTVKTSLLPRILGILEKSTSMQLKIKVLETILEIIGGIDQHTMKDVILKSFDKVRAQENDPHLYMLLMKIYEQMAKVLGVEEIGLKILPGMIPMLISGTFSKAQFKELIGTVRRFLDQIEDHRDKDLRDMGADIMKSSNPDDNKAFDFDQFENKKETPTGGSQIAQSSDVFDFLNSLDKSQATSGFGSNSGSASLFNSQGNQNPQDIFSSFNPPATTTIPVQQSAQKLQPPPSSVNAFNSDPFAGISGSSTTFGGSQQKQASTFASSGWDNDMPNILDFGNNQPKQTTSSFGTFGLQSQQTQAQTMGGFGSVQPRGGNLKSMSDDPFADLVEGGGGTSSNPTFSPPGLNNNQNTGFGSSMGGSMSALGGNTFNQQNNQPYLGNFGGAQQINNAFGGMNLGGGQPLNSFGASNMNTFGTTKPQQNNNDDFFSQFSGGNNQQQKNNQGGFNLF